MWEHLCIIICALFPGCIGCSAHGRFKKVWDGQDVFMYNNRTTSREILVQFEEMVNGSWSAYMKEVLAELGMGSGANMNCSREDLDDNSKGGLEDYDTVVEEDDEDNKEESEQLDAWFISCRAIVFKTVWY